jgi:hypothetical protein
MYISAPHGFYDHLGVAVEPRGLSVPSVWFGGGRLGVRLGGDGTIAELDYFGGQCMDRHAFYRLAEPSPYPKLFTPYLMVEDRAWWLEWEQTRVFPAGYVSRLALPEEGISLTHSLVVLNDAIVYRIQVQENPQRLPLRLRLAVHDYLRHLPPGRSWGDWRDDIAPGAPTAEIRDPRRVPKGQPPSGEFDSTWMGVAGSAPVSTRITTSGRRYFDTAVLSETDVTIAVVFGHAREEYARRAAELREHGPRLAAAQVVEWERSLATVPVMSLGRPAVESFFRQTDLMIDMLRVKDIPGGMRAAVGHYWIWGWDTMVYSDSDQINGRAAFVRQALDFYRRTADPKLGVGHQFSESLRILIPQALAAQGLYLNMLYQHIVYTDDREALQEFYPFARTLFQRTLVQGKSHGLFKGSALWPDHPRFAGQHAPKGQVSDRDLSIFNNGIFYQSARAMEQLAGMMGDAHTAAAARDAWLPLEEAFRAHFWDKARNYWMDSLETDTLTPRDSYPSHAVLWINSFGRELVQGREEACAAFLAANHVCAGGIRPYPLWDKAFNGDGNQLGQWYPTCPDHFFLKTMAATGRQDMLRRWLDWVGRFWRQYTVPEGMTLEAENDGPHRPDCPGGKQPFTIRSWHMALITGILGMDIDHGGFTVGPGLDEPVRISGLRFQGKTVSIGTRGAGTRLRGMTVNRRTISGTCKVPADCCADAEWHIEIERTMEPPASPIILSADGARLTQVNADAKSVIAQVECPAAVRVWIGSPRKPQVQWNGKSTEVQWDATNRRAAVFLAPEGTTLAGKLRIQA